MLSFTWCLINYFIFNPSFLLVFKDMERKYIMLFNLLSCNLYFLHVNLLCHLSLWASEIETSAKYAFSYLNINLEW